MNLVQRILNKNRYTALYCAGWLGGIASQASPALRVGAVNAAKSILKVP